MGAAKKTLIELIVLGAASIAVAATVNASRDKGGLSWTKAYFAKPSMAGSQPGVAPQPTEEGTEQTAEPTTGQPTEVAEDGGEDDPAPPFQHPYNSASIDDVIDVVNSDGYLNGLYILVDARSEEAYADGHIEGAMRCYHYELDDCIDKVLQAANGAEKVVVYCNGGDCEDSLFMCQELELRGVPRAAIYLFEGGWKEWTKQEMPFVTGSEK